MLLKYVVNISKSNEKNILFRNESNKIIDYKSELWRIFTFYCIQGNPREPRVLSLSQWICLLRDCQLIYNENTFVSVTNQRESSGYIGYSKTTRVRDMRRIGRSTRAIQFFYPHPVI